MAGRRRRRSLRGRGRGVGVDREGEGEGGDGSGERSPEHNAPPPRMESDYQSPRATAQSSDVVTKINFQPSDTISASSQPCSSSVSESPPALVQKHQSPASSIKFSPEPAGEKSYGHCTVIANHFPVKLDTDSVHQYSVSFKPDSVTTKKLCRRIIEQLVNENRGWFRNITLAFDGMNGAYTDRPLGFNFREFIVREEQSKRKYTVEIQLVAAPDLLHLLDFINRNREDEPPQETIKALDVVLRHTPASTYKSVGRSFFSQSFGKGELGKGLEYWRGFYQSLRLTNMGLSLNIDISARPFLESIDVTKFISKVLDIEDITEENTNIEKVKKALEGVIVETKHLKNSVYRKKISKLKFTNLSVKELSFVNKDRIRTYVVEHFVDKNKITLQYPFLPAFQFGGKILKYFPMEVCKIAKEQRYTRKLSEELKEALSNATCETPDERKEHINKMVNSYNTFGILKKFGIEVTPEFISIPARILPPPKLKYFEETCVDPKDGEWDMKNKKMYEGGRVENWTCVNFSTLDSVVVENFCKSLVDTCRSRGMVFSEKRLDVQTYHNPSQIEIEKCLVSVDKQFQELIGKQLQLLIVILHDEIDFYGTIKRVCETKLGLVSQCCKPTHLCPRPQSSYLENVALKINVKVGGRNTVLEKVEQETVPMMDVPTIFFGADVTHPPPGDKSSPSIAAVVGSVDLLATKYMGVVSTQSNRQEIIEDLYNESKSPKGMIIELLEAFRLSTLRVPRRIIFYRDGVGEGQFQEVVTKEIDAIRKACASLSPTYCPNITFIVVQKRHHTRLFPKDGSGNIVPGTVVDTKICRSKQMDFFLCSHKAIKGTSRPAHYHVILNENQISLVHLQELTNDLCYTYARCAKSVSVVPPAYYAHLLASRARCYIADGARVIPPIKENVKRVMFYC